MLFLDLPVFPVPFPARASYISIWQHEAAAWPYLARNIPLRESCSGEGKRGKKKKRLLYSSELNSSPHFHPHAAHSEEGPPSGSESSGFSLTPRLPAAIKKKICFKVLLRFYFLTDASLRFYFRPSRGRLSRSFIWSWPTCQTASVTSRGSVSDLRDTGQIQHCAQLLWSLLSKNGIKQRRVESSCCYLLMHDL